MKIVQIISIKVDYHLNLNQDLNKDLCQNNHKRNCRLYRKYIYKNCSLKVITNDLFYFLIRIYVFVCENKI